MVKTLIGSDNACFLLIGRKGLLRLLQFLAHELGLAFKPFGILTGRLDLKLEVYINVGLGKRIGHRGSKFRFNTGDILW